MEVEAYRIRNVSIINQSINFDLFDMAVAQSIISIVQIFVSATRRVQLLIIFKLIQLEFRKLTEE